MAETLMVPDVPFSLMRGWRSVTIVVLALAALAGCIGAVDEVEPEPNAVDDTGIDVDAIETPENAEVRPIEEGVRVLFKDVELPLTHEFQVPEGASMVRVTAHHANESGAIVPILVEEESGAYRCLPSLAKAWNVGINETTTCAGMTAIDGSNATWGVAVVGTGSIEETVGTPVVSLASGVQPGVAEAVQLDFVEEPPDGVAGEVDLDQLSQRHHEIGETTDHEVTSHDGSNLHVEVTTPPDDGHDAYPTLLISSPYTTSDRQAGQRPYDDIVKDYVSRGYAVAVADVRGFGQSEGCMEVWGPNEQKDQAVLVDWITDQDFSDGNVGMYGVSYPGTTPAQAAVQAPEGLEAIISIAGVLDAYKDWHFGGVPNGESIGSPAGYHQIGAQAADEDPLDRAMDHANGVCDPTLVARANDPRAVYDEFYEVRNLTARADEVEAAVMIEHGYNDVNVKSAMQVEWFNQLDVPKLGLLGHWHHQWASRADEVTLRLAWMDQFVKGEDVGLANVSEASVTANGDRYRETSAWPSPEATEETFHPDFEDESLSRQPADGQAELLVEGAENLEPVTGAVGNDELWLSTTVDEPVRLAGPAQMTLDVTLEGADNAYVAAHLFKDDGDQLREVTFGWTNLAHRGTHDSYEPWQPGERATVPLPFLPTETTFEEGDEMRLLIRGVSEADWFRYRPGQPAQLVLHGGEDGTTLQLPTLGEDAYRSTPLTATPTQHS
jgi:predicted acyl esterase